MKKTAFIFLLLSITYLLPAQVQLFKDESFGTNGKFMYSLPGPVDKNFLNTIAEARYSAPTIYKTNDNNLFVLFNNNNHFTLLKITPQGVLDSSFGTNGKILFDNFSNQWSSEFTYIENHTNTGFLVCQVNFSVKSTLITRYNNNGTIDTNFGEDGTITIPEGEFGISALMKPFTVYEDNSILFYGGKDTVKKYDETGVLITETPYTGETGEIPFALKNDSFYWLSNGFYDDYSKLSKTNLNGTPDMNFGTNGSVELPDNEVGNNSPRFNQKIDFYDEGYIFCLTQQFNSDSNNHLYSITPDGMLNEEFNAGTGYISIDKPIASDEYIALHDVILVNDTFFLAGYFENQFTAYTSYFEPIIYAIDKSGTIQNINSLPFSFYTEFAINNGGFIDMIELEGDIYVLGFDRPGPDPNSSEGEFFVTKYNASTLGVTDVTLDHVKVVNPFSDEIIISGLKAFKSIKLYDLAGQLVLTSKSLKINTSHLNAGNYILVIEDLNGKSTTHKLIKK